MCSFNQRFKACARSNRANTSVFVDFTFLHGLVRNTGKQKRALVLALSVGWATINKGSSQFEYWSQNVGYTLIKGTWRIAIQTREGADRADEDKIEEWPLTEAPRYLQPKAIEKLPELIEALIAATDAAAQRLEEQIAPAEELAAAVNAVVSPKKK